jgi:hypothetical protein
MLKAISLTPPFRVAILISFLFHPFHRWLFIRQLADIPSGYLIDFWKRTQDPFPNILNSDKKHQNKKVI